MTNAIIRLLLWSSAAIIAVLLALILLAGALVDAAYAVQRDRITRRGNQLRRLGQRLHDSADRLTAAMHICLE